MLLDSQWDSHRLRGLHPGLRCQVTDVVSLDSSEMLVVARHRETYKLTLWRLALQDPLVAGSAGGGWGYLFW